MSKKHFIALANAIRDFNQRVRTNELEKFDRLQINALANFCQSTNPNFNRDRWLSYIAGECGPNGGAIK